jgi:hypothetical protein
MAMIGLEATVARDGGAARKDRVLGWPARLTALVVSGSIALSGCGGKARAPAPASVQGSAISVEALARWTGIMRAEQQTAAASPSAPSPVSAQHQALAFLITGKWLEEEAAAQGVSVSPAAVNVTYQQLLNGLGGQAFADSLKRRGISSADELFQLRLAQLSVKLRTKIVAAYKSVSTTLVVGYYRAHPGQFGRRGQTLTAATPTIRQILLEAQRRQHLDAFTAAFRQRWKQRTICEPGYVIAECRNGPPLSASPAD